MTTDIFHLADRCIKLKEGQIKTIEYPASGLKTNTLDWEEKEIVGQAF